MTLGVAFLRVIWQAHVPTRPQERIPQMPTTAVIRPVIAAPANRRVRVFASLLIVGGLIGTGSSAVLAYRLAPLSLIAVDAAAFIAVFAWSSVVGLRLWQGDPRGTRWAIALYALQIPALEIHGFKYNYFTGVAILMLHNPGGSPVALDFGADMALMFEGDSGDFVLGVNVIAIAACALIATSERGKLWTHS
jgi:hypothetical protein